MDELELMNIDTGYIITDSGDMLDGCNFFIDKHNTVYEFDWDYGCVIPIEANAFNAYGIPIKFDKRNVEVMQYFEKN